MKNPGTIDIHPGQPLEQTFQWTTTDGEVPLEGAEIAVRWWKDNEPFFMSTTLDGSIEIVKDGEFCLKLTDEGTSKAAECNRYDIFAFLPEHGNTRVIQGPVQIAPDSNESAIPRQGA
jgi:hypothetical protein